MENLATAISRLEEACELLRSGSVTGIEHCTVPLASSVESLRVWREANARNEQVSVAEVNRLRKLVALARILLERAAEFHGGWLARLGTMACGYTLTGMPAGLANELPARLNAQG